MMKGVKKKWEHPMFSTCIRCLLHCFNSSTVQTKRSPRRYISTRAVRLSQGIL